MHGTFRGLLSTLKKMRGLKQKNWYDQFRRYGCRGKQYIVKGQALLEYYCDNCKRKGEFITEGPMF